MDMKKENTMAENALPTGWKTTTLGEVATFQRGFDLPKQDRTEGNFPIIVSNGYDGSHSESKVEGPGVVTGRSGSLGNVFYVEKDFWPLNTTLWIKDFHGNDIKYLYYYLKIFPFEKYNSGSGVPTLNRNHIHPLFVNIPPLKEQKAIAKVLSSFDDKIELLQEQNKTLEETAQTIFKEWFSDKNKEEWELISLNKVLEISSSKRIFSKEYVESGVPFYRSKEIIELSTKPSISTELYISHDRYTQIKNAVSVPIYGDILLTSVGTLGVAYQVRTNEEFYFKDGNLTWFKNFSKMITSDFVCCLLQQKSTQEQLKMISIGSTQKALTIAALRTLAIPIIKNVNKRKKLYAFLKANIDKKNINYSQIQSLNETRDELLPKLMSGQLRIKNL
jgi:type I restriction enzyme S subunit